MEREAKKDKEKKKREEKITDRYRNKQSKIN